MINRTATSSHDRVKRNTGTRFPLLPEIITKLDKLRENKLGLQTQASTRQWLLGEGNCRVSPPTASA